MYSPKISEDLIPQLYRIRVREGIPMTRLVNQILTQFIKEYQNEDRNYQENPAAETEAA